MVKKTIVLAMVILLSGCGFQADLSPKTKGIDATGTVATIATTMPVDIHAELEAIVKNALQQYEQSSKQSGSAGGNLYNISNNVAGGGAVAIVLILTMAFIAAVKYHRSNKALKTTIGALVHGSHEERTILHFHSCGDSYLRRRVEKWYPETMKLDGSMDVQSQQKTVK